MGCVCFTDSDLKVFLKKLFKCFAKGSNYFFSLFLLSSFSPSSSFLTPPVTRYIRREMQGVEKEVHYSNAEDIFLNYPNVHRDYVYANLSHPVAN